MGDQNADPEDGHSFPQAIRNLLDSSRVNSSFTPASDGGPEAARLQAEYNRRQKGDPAFDTSAFGESGNMRVDYVLPSADMKIRGGGVYWLPTASPLFKLVTDGQFPSDHRLVYVDVSVPTDATGSAAGGPAGTNSPETEPNIP